jgi:hypothetical protein
MMKCAVSNRSKLIGFYIVICIDFEMSAHLQVFIKLQYFE